jgi:1,2-diacylglycerol 3-alpha-glucosyltransferase
MRIAFFSDNFYPELSGITDTLITTGKELARRGHAVLYVGPRYTHKDYELAKKQFPLTKDKDTIDGLPIIRLPSFHLPSSPTGQSRFALPTGYELASVRDFNPDVIHTQSPYGTGWAALRVARGLELPLVGTNHTAIEDFFPLPSVMRSYDAWYYNRCDRVTAPYRQLIERMREKGFRKPAQVVANPAELGAFTPASASEKMSHKKAFGLTGPVVLYAGRLGVEKHVEVIVRAIASLVPIFPDITFIATGHGAAESKLKALAQQLGIGKHVRFPGFVAREQLPHIYKAADVFSIMSTSDSQSIALMQAYATGLPAVCANSKGLPDYTPSDCGFLVEPGDSSALAVRLTELLQNAALRERMGKAAVKFVSKLSPEKIAREWEALYQSVITT